MSVWHLRTSQFELTTCKCSEPLHLVTTTLDRAGHRSFGMESFDSQIPTVPWAHFLNTCSSLLLAPKSHLFFHDSHWVKYWPSMWCCCLLLSLRKGEYVEAKPFSFSSLSYEALSYPMYICTSSLERKRMETSRLRLVNWMFELTKENYSHKWVNLIFAHYECLLSPCHLWKFKKETQTEKQILKKKILLACLS